MNVHKFNHDFSCILAIFAVSLFTREWIEIVSAVIKPKEQLVDIYPVGSVKRGRITTRNAEKAAYLHYGVKGRIEESKFMDNVKKDSEVASQNAMQSEFNQILREKGL